MIDHHVHRQEGHWCTGNDSDSFGGPPAAAATLPFRQASVKSDLSRLSTQYHGRRKRNVNVRLAALHAYATRVHPPCAPSRPATHPRYPLHHYCRTKRKCACPPLQDREHSGRGCTNTHCRGSMDDNHSMHRAPSDWNQCKYCAVQPDKPHTSKPGPDA